MDWGMKNGCLDSKIALRFAGWLIIQLRNIYINFQIARTELIKNDQSPQFAKAIQLEYRFEEAQKLRFAVYDLDNDTASLDDDDFLGSLECSLGEVCYSSHHNF